MSTTFSSLFPEAFVFVTVCQRRLIIYHENILLVNAFSELFKIVLSCMSNPCPAYNQVTILDKAGVFELSRLYVLPIKRLKQVVIILVAALAAATFFMYKRHRRCRYLKQNKDPERFIKERPHQNMHPLRLILAGETRRLFLF